MFQKCVYPALENQLQRLFAQLMMIANTLWKKNFSDHLKSFLLFLRYCIGDNSCSTARGLQHLGRLETSVLSSKVANKTILQIIQESLSIKGTVKSRGSVATAVHEGGFDRGFQLMTPRPFFRMSVQVIREGDSHQ